METQKNENGFNIYSVGELLNMEIPEMQWIWEDIFPAGGLSLVVGQPKAGVNLGFCSS